MEAIGTSDGLHWIHITMDIVPSVVLLLYQKRVVFVQLNTFACVKDRGLTRIS